MLDIIKPTQLSYNYDLIPAADREPVRQAALEIKPRLSRAAEDIFAIGAKLNEIKDRLPHGQWGKWLDEEFELTDRTARHFMSVASRLSDKSETVSDLSARALYLLAAPSTPDEVVDAVVEKVASGQSVTAAEVKRTIDAAKPAPATASVDDLTRHIGSWLSQQQGNVTWILSGASNGRSNAYRVQIEGFLHRRDVKFSHPDLDMAIRQVRQNIQETVGDNATLSGPRPALTRRDLDEIEKAKPQPPTAVQSTTEIWQIQDVIYMWLRKLTPDPVAQLKVMEDGYQFEVIRNQNPKLGMTSNQIMQAWNNVKEQLRQRINQGAENGIDYYQAHGWKITQTGDTWQAIHHGQQMATQAVSSQEILLTCLKARKYSEDLYFLDEEPAQSPVTEEKLLLDWTDEDWANHIAAQTPAWRTDIENLLDSAAGDIRAAVSVCVEHTDQAGAADLLPLLTAVVNAIIDAQTQLQPANQSPIPVL